MRHLLNKTLLSSGALASLLLSVSLTSCQDEDYGYTQGEIHQSYLNRKYAEEFAKAFPNADPNHTWMCIPDTFGVESLIEGSATRAYPTGMVPQVTKMGESETVTALFVEQALIKLPEAEDNRGLVTQSFDYTAVEDDGSSNTDNYAEFIITPTFWGRKFCGANSVGIYWYDNDGYRNEEETYHFWHDYTDGNGVGSGIQVKYANNVTESLVNSEYPINCDITWTNYKYDYPLGKPCPVCADIHDGTTYLKYDAKRDNDDDSKWNEDVTIIDKYNAKCIVIVSKENPTTEWDTRLRVKTSGEWKAGETYTFHMDYLCDWGYTSNAINYQLQNAAGDYLGGGSTNKNLKGQYDSKMSLSRDSNNEFHWVDGSDYWEKDETYDFTFTFKIPDNANGVKQICLDLNPKNNEGNPTGSGKKIWVKNVSCVKQGCSYCGGTGYYPVTNFILPQYLVKIPVGMKWGIYFDTKKQQGGGNDADNFTRYYSNASLNSRLVKYNGETFTGNVYAAATFEREGITYCCFEDAATNLHHGGADGDCSCGYGHYDTDYNDFVFSIKGRPVTNSYEAIKYRVMCEDLGGTWDWDFNDIVYDVVYADAESGAAGAKATIKVILQAVGGTLPVHMQFAENTGDRDEINNIIDTGGNITTGDLHRILDSSQTGPDTKGLYIPVNVKPGVNQRTTHQDKDPKVVCTYTLVGEKYSHLDVRSIVKMIKILVNQTPLKPEGSNTTTTVHFPTSDGSGNLVPECFMTSIDNQWTAENKKISDEYPKFLDWVNLNKNQNWWNIGF